MKELMGKYTIKEIAEYLKVTRQGFYRWRKNGHGKRYHDDVRLQGKIIELFHASKQTYGAIRIAKDLQDDGINCGKYRTLRLMKEAGLTPKAKRKFKATTDSKHSKGIAPNLLEQEFTADAPDSVWVGDITYVPTREGWGSILPSLSTCFHEKWSVGR